jgi:carboxypeptidase PM20D1
MKRILTYLLFAALALFGVLTFNTLRSGRQSTTTVQAVNIPAYDSSAEHLAEAIRIRTVSFGDTLPIDTAQFDAFLRFMERTYPQMHSRLEHLTFNGYSHVFKWRGADTSLAPHVLMAHLDVVPVEAAAEGKWTQPPFGGTIVKDTVWGRGAVDDKGSAIAIMEAAERLLKEGFTPKQTVYLCFGHDEEVSGKRGMAKVSAWFKESGIRPALVLDEGGMIDTRRFDIGRPVAVIGTGEKGYTNIDLSVEIPGGHSSMPERETAIDVLNAAIAKVRSEQMPVVIPPAIRELLQRTGAYQSFGKRMALSNLWLFEGPVVRQLESSKETNAFVHTTLVPTIVRSGIKDNVIPSVAKATFNSRIIPGQTSDDVLEFVKRRIGDERVKVTKQTVSLMEPSASTPTTHAAFQKIEELTQQVVPQVVVSPYLLVGATDSRYFRPFSEAVLNFTPMQDVKGFHGIDERIGVADLHRMIHFYRLLMGGQ